MFDRIANSFSGSESLDLAEVRAGEITAARMLTLILRLLFFVAAGSLVALAYPLDLGRLSGERLALIAVSGGVLVATQFLQWMVRRGWARSAAILFMGTLWGGVTLWLWLISGISSNQLAFLYPLIVVLASMLLGQPGAWVFMVLSIIGIVGAHTAERSGRLPVQLSLVMPEDLVAMSVVLIVLTVMLIRGRRRLTVAVQAAQQAALERERASRQLETMQASLEQRVDERTRELSVSGTALQAAADIGRAAAAQETVDALTSQVALMIAEQFECYHVGIYLLADGGDGVNDVRENESYQETRAFLQAHGGAGGTGVPTFGHEVLLENGSVIAEAIRDRALKLAFGPNIPRTAFSLDPALLSDHSARLSETEVEVVLPLAVGSVPVGAIDMHIADLSVFYQQSLDPLRIMADQVAVAITAARRLQQSRAALQAERDAYRQISREGWIQLLQSGIVPGYRYRNHQVEPIGEMWHPEMRAALRQNTRILTAEMEATTTNEVDGAASDGGGAVASLPIHVREQTIGVLHIRKRQGTGNWTTRELELLDSLTNQLEAALESARLYRETQQAAIQQRTIAEVGSSIREEIDIEAILARALGELGSALAADRGAVLLTLDETGEEAA